LQCNNGWFEGKTQVLELADLVKGKAIQKITFVTPADKEAWKTAIGNAQAALTDGKHPVPQAIIQ